MPRYFHYGGLALLALAFALPTQAQSQVDSDTPGVRVAPPEATASPHVDDRDVPGSTQAGPLATSRVPRMDDSDDPSQAIVSRQDPPTTVALRTGREGAIPALRVASGAVNPYPDGRDPAAMTVSALVAEAGLRTTTADGRSLDARPGAPVMAAEEAATPEVGKLIPEEAKAAVSGLVLAANAPNPVGIETRISFAVPTTGHARVEVFDARGRLVSVVFDGVAEAGLEQTVVLNATDLASGTYVYALTHDRERVTRTLQVAR